MNVIDVRAFESDFVIYFGGEPKRINAYTLASSLVSIADAVKAANTLINPGYDVEVVVEAFGEGSFKAKVRTLYSGASNLFSAENLKTITLSVVAAYVYQQTLSPDQEINVVVNTAEVIVEQGDNKIIVPRDVHDCVKEVEKSEKFTQSIGKTFEAVEKDKNIESMGFMPSFDDEIPIILIPRARFGLISAPPEVEDNQREVLEVADLHILRAILERGKRKWEFVWRGIKISAPVLDQQFFDDFFAHKIMIAPGDSIEVRLRIYQSRDQDTGIFTNNRYEVVEVLRHIPRMKQVALHD
ncbi:hypothetical protein [Halomonas chromatireducens]|uniref:Uncharacterized protein n=1 Tax=Halomonas chromatireducens TaxID=507626 RepID=A0A125R0B1_9GAMM|nr:hypothetical protein [Halomonas chromatireducens]AMD01602.1 hypothetical protein LOKO_02542 [Halomonas chromatireducens]